MIPQRHADYAAEQIEQWIIPFMKRALEWMPDTTIPAQLNELAMELDSVINAFESGQDVSHLESKAICDKCPDIRGEIREALYRHYVEKTADNTPISQRPDGDFYRENARLYVSLLMDIQRSQKQSKSTTVQHAMAALIKWCSDKNATWQGYLQTMIEVDVALNEAL